MVWQSPRCQVSETEIPVANVAARLSVAKGPCQASVKSPETQGGFAVGEAMLVTAVVSDHCKFIKNDWHLTKSRYLRGLDSKCMIWCENIAWCRNHILPVGTFWLFHFCIQNHAVAVSSLPRFSDQGGTFCQRHGKDLCRVGTLRTFQHGVIRWVQKIPETTWTPNNSMNNTPPKEKQWNLKNRGLSGKGDSFLEPINFRFYVSRGCP